MSGWLHKFLSIDRRRYLACLLILGVGLVVLERRLLLPLGLGLFMHELHQLLLLERECRCLLEGLLDYLLLVGDIDLVGDLVLGLYRSRIQCC